MASDTRNVKLGVCLVYFDGADLGYTKGGVEVSVTTETHKVEIDQFGKTPINEQIMGREARVKVPLAETTLENLVATMPGATLVIDAQKKRVDVEHGIGTDLLTVARPLILHPQRLALTDKSEDFTLLLAATSGGLQFGYKLEEERIFSVEFMGYPSSATKKMFALGDLTASAIACTFNQATDTVTATAHGLVTGQMVIFSATSFPDVTGMVFGKGFFVNVTDANTFTIHSTPADAIAGTNDLTFTTAGTAVVAYPV